MLCQDCQKRNATIHFVSDINGERQELKLCSQCMRKRRQDLVGAMSFAINMNDLLAGFAPQAEAPKGLQCPNCGMTSEEALKEGRIGCVGCYDTFSEWLESVMLKVHGRSEHRGKIPARGGEGLQLRRKLDELKTKQRAAIDEEHFERAAELRDQIRALEEKINSAPSETAVKEETQHGE